ncbi:unnamed protein product [Penicillium bialowiezense]
MAQSNPAQSTCTQPSEPSEFQIPHLPACQFCHNRKIKCDDIRPKCGPCTKHGETCVTLRVDEHDSIPRQYIGDLENKIKIFQNQLEQTRSSEPGSIPPSVETIGAIGNDGRIGSTQLKEPGNRDHTHSPSFTEGGGISFMRHLFTDSSWRHQDSSLLRNLSKTSGPAEAGIKPNALPSAAEARILFDK